VIGGVGSRPIKGRFSIAAMRRGANTVMRQIGTTLWSPIRWLLAVRRVLTPASVTLLLVGIVSGNIIWGYPWIGAFSACTALFIVGFVLNRCSLPSLRSDYLLPRSAVANAPFLVRVLLSNRGRLPALELEVDLGAGGKHPNQAGSALEIQSNGEFVRIIRPQEQIELNARIIFRRRGIHALPAVSVVSWFPFHLFRLRRFVATDAVLPVTPERLDDDQDAAARALLTSLGNWTRRSLAGDAADYTGSREYETGMPVRRWDFVSWARLGRPIIREYQSQSVRAVTLIVDTASDASTARDGVSTDWLLERVLSLAATAIECLSRPSVQLRMLVTGQAVEPDAEQHLSGQHLAGQHLAGQHWRGPRIDFPADRESLLIQLAAATRSDESDATAAIQAWCADQVRTPLLIISSRPDPAGDAPLPPSASLLLVELPNADLTGSRSLLDER
jgi:uncharacterized protein (DUF58 family)